MFRPVCTRGASHMRRMLNGPGMVSTRNFCFRPWYMYRPLVPADRLFRQLEREMDRAYDSVWDRSAFRRSPSIFGKEVPVQVAPDGSGQISLKVDVSQFAPEEVRVTLRNGVLTIRARHEETDKDGGKVYREYVSEHTLPSEVNEESIQSMLGKDGMLTIEASVPVVEDAKETEIPIQKGKTAAKN